MRYLVWLLAAALLCALPGHAWAQLHGSSQQRQQAASCVIRVSDDDAPPNHHLQCMIGLVVKVSDTGMKVRPPHGAQRKLRFTDKTLFETDSGEGVLDGLVSGDYVCVGYTSHSGNLTALVVLFDPESSPCSSRKQDSSWEPHQVSRTSYPISSWP